MERFKSLVSWSALIILVCIFYYLKVNYNITLDGFGNTLIVLAALIIKFVTWNNPKDPDNF